MTDNQQNRGCRGGGRRSVSRDGSFIAPERLYVKQHFMKVAALTRTRVSDAKRKYQLRLKTLDVGINRYVRGADGIEFIEKLAEAMAAEQRGRSAD